MTSEVDTLFLPYEKFQEVCKKISSLDFLLSLVSDKKERENIRGILEDTLRKELSDRKLLDSFFKECDNSLKDDVPKEFDGELKKPGACYSINFEFDDGRVYSTSSYIEFVKKTREVCKEWKDMHNDETIYDLDGDINFWCYYNNRYYTATNLFEDGDVSDKQIHWKLFDSD